MKSVVSVPVDPEEDFYGITGIETPNGLRFDKRPSTNVCEGCAFDHNTPHDGCVCEDLPPCSYTNIIWVEAK